MVNAQAGSNRDLVEARLRQNTMLASVQVRVFSTAVRTYVELWQKSAGTSDELVRVWHQSFARSDSSAPDVLVMAAYLARMTSGLDREGWEHLRS